MNTHHTPHTTKALHQVQTAVENIANATTDAESFRLLTIALSEVKNLEITLADLRKQHLSNMATTTSIRKVAQAVGLSYTVTHRLSTK